jgi:hypothetical protein
MINLRDYGLDPRNRQARAKRVAVAIAAAWKATAHDAGDDLGSVLRDYKRGIAITETNPDFVIVTLQGVVPNLLERGQAPHDMRDYLLRTVRPGAAPIRRDKKGRPYRFIMFRRKVTEIRRMGDASAYSDAKTLTATMSGSEGKLIYGSRMDSGRAQHYINKSGVRSVSDALSGMVKLVGVSTSEGAKRGANTTYATWRTVSYKRPEAWQHPGRQALNLAQSVISNISEIVESAGL